MNEQQDEWLKWFAIWQWSMESRIVLVALGFGTILVSAPIWLTMLESFLYDF